MVETKSKLAEKDNSGAYVKYDSIVGVGCYKRVKPALDLTIFKQPEALVNLVITRTKDTSDTDWAKIVEEAKKEQAISLMLPPEMASHLLGMKVYQGKNGKNKISFYSKKAICSLDKAFSKENPLKLSELVKFQILLNAMDLLTTVHQYGAIPCDTHQGNFLLFNQPNGGYSVKLSDFGAYFPLNEQEKSLSKNIEIYLAISTALELACRIGSENKKTPKDDTYEKSFLSSRKIAIENLILYESSRKNNIQLTEEQIKFAEAQYTENLKNIRTIKEHIQAEIKILQEAPTPPKKPPPPPPPPRSFPPPALSNANTNPVNPTRKTGLKR